MEYSFKQKILNLVCKVIGHFPRDPWFYEHPRATCCCCKKVVTDYGNGWE